MVCLCGGGAHEKKKKTTTAAVCEKEGTACLRARCARGVWREGVCVRVTAAPVCVPKDFQPRSGGATTHEQE